MIDFLALVLLMTVGFGVPFLVLRWFGLQEWNWSFLNRYGSDDDDAGNDDDDTTPIVPPRDPGAALPRHIERKIEDIFERSERKAQKERNANR
jgi:hypothetical protein